MNQLASTELYASPSAKCPKCGMHVEKSSGCCRDEVKIVKMADDQQFSGAIQVLTDAPVFALAQLSHADASNKIIEQQAGLNSLHKPPLRSIPDLCILHAIFRI